MSRRDEERREETKANATERGKSKLRFGQQVLTAFVDDEPVRQTAKRLGCSPSTVMLARAFLELETGRSWKHSGKRTGRLRESDLRVSHG
ncbi:MAG: hypothetical protein JNM17_04060 [Archangium sp.]|nr:hypothetical protein [Archangium sp.]